MDPRRLLMIAAAGLAMSGCALFRPEPVVAPLAAGTSLGAPQTGSPAGVAEPMFGVPELTSVEEEAAPTPTPEATVGRPYLSEARNERRPTDTTPAVSGRSAIAAANTAARTPSRDDSFIGGVQVFAWSPGRVFEVWTAPLRVTTLSLAPGETLVAKAAGDTVRWQIGEAMSGDGAGRITHVLLKPLERGLETNLILTTNRRVYLIDLKSGAAGGFNAAVAWDAGSLVAVPPPDVVAAATEQTPIPDPVAMPNGEIDAGYRIEPQGRRARWTPTSVFNDGQRTFITFDADLQVDEAPVLFVIAPDGESQMVNYRQAGGLFIVDRLFDRAELRLGDRRPQVVRIRRVSGARS